MRQAVLLVAVLLVCCTAEDPGPKKCEVGSDDPDVQCVAGYVCDCQPDGCLCVKKSALQLHVTLPAPPVTTQAADPYRALLRRIGAFDPPVSRR